MSDLSLVLENFFATASETFQDTLSSSIAAEATTVPILNATEYAEGDVVVLTVEPGTANEATFIGVKDTGNQIIDCVWTEGNTAVGHDAGATIIDYDSATHFNAAMKGILQFANQDGTLKTDPVRAALGLGDESVSGWEVLPYTLQVASGYNQGNNSFEVTVANNDLTDEISVGQRIRLARSTAGPTQCLDLESGSSQYAFKSAPTGIAFTDDFTCEIWAKPESYTGAVASMISRYDGTTGFKFFLGADGSLGLIAYGTAGVWRSASVKHCPSVAKWSHLAATMDMSGVAGTVYINGVSLSVTMGNSGTPSALIQAGNYQVGAANGANELFDGKLSDARTWNAIRTQLQIRDNMNQQLVGNETNLVAYHKLNGDLNDSTSSANHLTGSGGAVATNVDSPMPTTVYALVAAISYSAPNTTLILYTGVNGPIPNQTLNAPYFSTYDAPYGFPKDREKWSIESIMRTSQTQAAPVTNTWYNMGGLKILVPIGSWLTQNKGIVYSDRGSAGPIGASISLSKSASAEDDKLTGMSAYQGSDTGFILPYEIHHPVENNAATTYYKILRTTQTSPANIQDGAGDATSLIRIYPNFL